MDRPVIGYSSADESRSILFRRGPRHPKTEVAELVHRDCYRHSFCSHLVMKGAPAKAIQELAGHRVSPLRHHSRVALLDSVG